MFLVQHLFACLYPIFLHIILFYCPALNNEVKTFHIHVQKLTWLLSQSFTYMRSKPFSLLSLFMYYHFLWAVQIPLYPATIFQSEADGEGMSVVLYFKLSDSYSEELPLHFQENFRVRYKLLKFGFQFNLPKMVYFYIHIV